MLREVLIDFKIKCMIMNMKLIFIILLLTPLFAFAEVNSWECNKFEGAEIIAEDGTELGKLGIRVNCIIPGVIRTPMTSQYIDDNYEKIIKPIALERAGSCEEVANGVLFLCSDLASYITGAILGITGGKYITQI